MEDNKKIKVGGELMAPHRVRLLKDMPEVIYDQEWLKSANPQLELYYMYRDLAVTPADRKRLEGANLRYDITVIPPKLLGCEYVKTLGHYHPLVPKTKLSYPELYEILEGKGHFLLQNFVGGRVQDVILIEAKKGEIIVIPPNYGHIAINPSQEELKMANLVARNFSSLYRAIKEKKGGAYFELKEGWVRNENYSNLPELRILKPTRGIFESNIYDSFKESSSKFEFLTSPLEYEGLFEEIKIVEKL